MGFWGQGLSSSHYPEKVIGSDKLGDSHRCSWEAQACPHSPLCHTELVCLTAGPADRPPSQVSGCWLTEMEPLSRLVPPLPLDVLKVSCLASTSGRLVSDFSTFSDAPAPLSRPSFASSSCRSVKSDSYKKSLFLLNSSWLFPCEAWPTSVQEKGPGGRGREEEGRRQGKVTWALDVIQLTWPPAGRGPS